MTESEDFTFLMSELEQLMVQQFRGLQHLVEITRAERQAITTHAIESLMQTTEAKEAQLDQLSLLEDGFRMVVHRILIRDLALNQETDIADHNPADDSNLNMILPSLPESSADRLRRLADGILTLVRQARDLNLGNQILVQNQLDWVQSCRSFLFEGMQTLDIYTPGFRSAPAAPGKRADRTSTGCNPAVAIDYRI